MASVIEDNVDDFTITSPREVMFYLRQLIQHGERLSVIFNEGRDSFLTVLVDLNEDDGLLYFDWGGSEEINRRFLQADRAFFVCAPQGIRNQFMCGKAWEVEVDRRRAYATRLPARYIRLQRREFFRLTLPMSLRPQVGIQSEQNPQRLVVSLIDIGIGGVCLEAPVSRLPYTPGEILTRVGINLGTFGRIDVELNVRSNYPMSRGNKEVTRLGCQFVKLSGAQEHTIQRFITHIQREEKARTG